MKDPDRKGYLLVNPETKQTAEKIFDLASRGMGEIKITQFLVEEKAPIPSWLHHSREGTYAWFYESEPEGKRHAWYITVVKKISKDKNYIRRRNNKLCFGKFLRCNKRPPLSGRSLWSSPCSLAISVRRVFPVAMRPRSLAPRGRNPSRLFFRSPS